MNPNSSDPYIISARSCSFLGAGDGVEDDGGGTFKNDFVLPVVCHISKLILGYV